MKRIFVLLRIGMCIPTLLLSVLFVLIESMRLLTLDFLLYDMPVIAAVQIILRCLLPLATAVSAFRAIRGCTTLFEGICLLCASVTAFPLLSNGFEWVFFIAALLFFSAAVLSDRIHKTESKNQNHR